MTQQPVLSIIIVNYNTAQLTVAAVQSIEQSYPKEVAAGQYEIIVSDNASTDNSLGALDAYKRSSKIKYLTIIANKINLGFSKGNNIAVKQAKGSHILFLNPDTVMYPKTLPTLLTFIDTHPDAGAVGCKVTIPGGEIDEASHRGFPTPWNAFCHFSKLEKLFPHSRLFAGYLQGWKDMDTIHTVDAIVGACMLVKREAGEAIGWFDEDYFFYGEDVDFCFMLHEKGYTIYYVPTVSILHYGGVSSGIKKQSQTITTATVATRTIVQNARFAAMRIFYTKHYKNKYPAVVTAMVLVGISYLHRKNIPRVTV